MKKLVILSGKGGTGKTSLAAALAHLGSKELSLVLADADVDAANLELVLEPSLLESEDFVGGKLAVIDSDRCTACGICKDVCRFEAILNEAILNEDILNQEGVPGDPVYRVDELACEGCAACFYQCPSDAIAMKEQRAGKWYRSDTRFGPLFHAHLFAAHPLRLCLRSHIWLSPGRLFPGRVRLPWLRSWALATLPDVFGWLGGPAVGLPAAP